MKRTKTSSKSSLQVNQRILDGLMTRAGLAGIMGKQYSGKRDLYKALGYPVDADLTYEYYLARYKRQDIASAIIDRPANKTWTGKLQLLEADTIPSESVLTKEWLDLDLKYGVKKILKKLDKLSNLGQYSILLFGFNDVKDIQGFSRPIAKGKKLDLLYLKAIPEGSCKIDQWEQNTKNERYGFPLYYNVSVNQPDGLGTGQTIQIHHSRILHCNNEALDSDIFGRPALQPIINRLIDIEKVLGGDGETFWRGARPGYTALSRPDYDMGDAEITELEGELDKYEHDLRRFITAQGVDIKALEQQIADPLTHLDAQLQAISAQTGIPKRILIGSERGELSSAQDANEWLSLIKTRQEEFAEPMILRPFIEKCMELGILSESPIYSVIWDDVFSLSEKDKVSLGLTRAQALKTYSDSLTAQTLMPIEVAAKYLLGFSPQEVLEIMDNIDEVALEEDAQLARQPDVVEVVAEEVIEDPPLERKTSKRGTVDK